MNKMDRRKFFKIFGLTSAGAALSPLLKNNILAKKLLPEKPSTNIKDALKYPRTSESMPGKFPGKVVQILNEKSIVENKFDQSEIDEMIKRGMLSLTGKDDINEAWRMFVSPKDKIGLKVNPVAGTLLSTSPEVVKAIIKQLEAADIPKENLIIWDRREFELNEVGFTDENFPGIKIIGTERKDKNGSFYNADGKLYGEEMIDRNWYYFADCEEKYDAETLPYMINEGKYSYFTKIATQMVDKIINIPILKNAGSSITLCLKNLAYGSISNTGRLHKELWAETCAEVCAFPPLRDKVVLNIVDGIKGCFQGGPGANPQFITNFKTILIGSDPVAVDRIGYDIILKKRLEEKIQKEDSPKGRFFLELAQNLQLGVADIEKIKLEKIEIK
ncbi:MAG: DUF362 domain-containing protein [Ignavibacteriales bacterium]|nr:DUF362 domain-containing protein [Ignavibacteriales bacterium]